MEIIKEGVKIDRLFKPFKGNLKGSSYNSLFPPPMRLDNAKICEQFRDFITDTIVNWLDTGVLAVWGRVGEGTSPHLVLPLTVEPSKPRLCHDERFLNLWIKDLPFKLDHLMDLPRYVVPGHFQTSFDDKKWLSACAASSFVTYFLWLAMEWRLFCVLHSPVWMEGECLYISQSRSCRHECSAFVWGSCVSINRRSSRWSTLSGASQFHSIP